MPWNRRAAHSMRCAKVHKVSPNRCSNRWGVAPALAAPGGSGGMDDMDY